MHKEFLESMEEYKCHCQSCSLTTQLPTALVPSTNEIIQLHENNGGTLIEEHVFGVHVIYFGGAHGHMLITQYTLIWKAKLGPVGCLYILLASDSSGSSGRSHSINLEDLEVRLDFHNSLIFVI